MSTTQPLAYTDAEVSALLHVSRRTVYRLRRSGALRAIRIGRAVRTPADDLAQFLERARIYREGECAGKGKQNESESAGSQQSKEAVGSGVCKS